MQAFRNLDDADASPPLLGWLKIFVKGNKRLPFGAISPRASSRKVIAEEAAPLPAYAKADERSAPTCQAGPSLLRSQTWMAVGGQDCAMAASKDGAQDTGVVADPCSIFSNPLVAQEQQLLARRITHLLSGPLQLPEPAGRPSGGHTAVEVLNPAATQDSFRWSAEGPAAGALGRDSRNRPGLQARCRLDGRALACEERLGAADAIGDTGSTLTTLGQGLECIASPRQSTQAPITSSVAGRAVTCSIGVTATSRATSKAGGGHGGSSGGDGVGPEPTSASHTTSSAGREDIRRREAHSQEQIQVEDVGEEGCLGVDRFLTGPAAGGHRNSGGLSSFRRETERRNEESLARYLLETRTEVVRSGRHAADSKLGADKPTVNDSSRKTSRDCQIATATSLFEEHEKVQEERREELVAVTRRVMEESNSADGTADPWVPPGSSQTTSRRSRISLISSEHTTWRVKASTQSHMQLRLQGDQQSLEPARRAANPAWAAAAPGGCGAAASGVATRPDEDVRAELPVAVAGPKYPCQQQLSLGRSSEPVYGKSYHQQHQYHCHQQQQQQQRESATTVELCSSSIETYSWEQHQQHTVVHERQVKEQQRSTNTGTATSTCGVATSHTADRISPRLGAAGAAVVQRKSGEIVTEARQHHHLHHHHHNQTAASTCVAPNPAEGREGCQSSVNHGPSVMAPGQAALSKTTTASGVERDPRVTKPALPDLQAIPKQQKQRQQWQQSSKQLDLMSSGDVVLNERLVLSENQGRAVTLPCLVGDPEGEGVKGEEQEQPWDAAGAGMRQHRRVRITSAHRAASGDDRAGGPAACIDGGADTSWDVYTAAAAARSSLGGAKSFGSRSGKSFGSRSGKSFTSHSGKSFISRSGKSFVSASGKSFGSRSGKSRSIRGAPSRTSTIGRRSRSGSTEWCGAVSGGGGGCDADAGSDPCYEHYDASSRALAAQAPLMRTSRSRKAVVSLSALPPSALNPLTWQTAIPSAGGGGGGTSCSPPSGGTGGGGGGRGLTAGDGQPGRAALLPALISPVAPKTNSRRFQSSDGREIPGLPSNLYLPLRQVRPAPTEAAGAAATAAADEGVDAQAPAMACGASEPGCSAGSSGAGSSGKPVLDLLRRWLTHGTGVS